MSGELKQTMKKKRTAGLELTQEKRKSFKEDQGPCWLDSEFTECQKIELYILKGE